MQLAGIYNGEEGEQLVSWPRARQKKKKELGQCSMISVVLQIVYII